MIGHPITRIRLAIEDGLAHSVDSNELAFRLCTQYAVQEGKTIFLFFTRCVDFVAVQKAAPQILEPIMNVSVSAPAEYQVTLNIAFLLVTYTSCRTLSLPC